MSTLTVDELVQIMRECAGEDEAVDLDGNVGDVEFELLGYDSLALMEAASRVTRMYDVELSDDELLVARTPNQFIALVNRQLASAASG